MINPWKKTAIGTFFDIQTAWLTLIIQQFRIYTTVFETPLKLCYLNDASKKNDIFKVC